MGHIGHFEVSLGLKKMVPVCVTCVVAPFGKLTLVILEYLGSVKRDMWETMWSMMPVSKIQELALLELTNTRVDEIKPATFVYASALPKLFWFNALIAWTKFWICSAVNSCATLDEVESDTSWDSIMFVVGW